MTARSPKGTKKNSRNLRAAFAGKSQARCLRCGRVADLEVITDGRWVSRIPKRGFRATGFHVELLGECAACRRR